MALSGTAGTVAALLVALILACLRRAPKNTPSSALEQRQRKLSEVRMAWDIGCAQHDRHIVDIALVKWLPAARRRRFRHRLAW